MKYRIQKIFDRFVCQGADCEATCCEGWKIEIDRESYEAYKKIRGKLGLLLLLGIDPKTRCFRMLVCFIIPMACVICIKR